MGAVFFPATTTTATTTTVLMECVRIVIVIAIVMLHRVSRPFLLWRILSARSARGMFGIGRLLLLLHYYYYY
jgi:hypothetical protein